MKKIFIITCLLFSAFIHAQQKISISDFISVEGKWKGTLTYLDYTSNKLTTIPANTLIEIINEYEFDQYVYYTEEPDKNKKSRYIINTAGTAVSDGKLVEKTIQQDGSIKLVLESSGPDGNDKRPAVFRHIMILSANKFVVTKTVRFEGEKDFFERHTYSFSR
jgi:hypothetical protein